MKKRSLFAAILILALGFLFGCKTEENPPIEGDDPTPPVSHTHTWLPWTEKKATCTEPGEKSRQCKECNEVEHEVLPALNHSYKDGYCIRCDAIDPSNVGMIDGREFEFVKISVEGILSFSRLKCASKYELSITYAGQTEKEIIEIDKSKGSYALENLPVGRTMVKLTAYEKVEVEIDHETHYQDVPISTATDEFRITKVNQSYTLERLKYTDEYITLTGFYDVPRKDEDTNEEYYLYETIYKKPNLGNIMNTSDIKNANNFKLKDTSQYKLVYYESNGTTAFDLGMNHYMSVRRAQYTKYYIAVVDKNTEQEVRRYPIKTYGLTEVKVIFKQLTIHEEDGNRTEESSIIKDSLNLTEKDILSKEELYKDIDSTLLARTENYKVLNREEDFIVPASNSYDELTIYYYEADLVQRDCDTYRTLEEDFVLSSSDFGWILAVRTEVEDVVVPAKILGRPVIRVTMSSVLANSLTLEEGITSWIVSLYDCQNLKRIILPSTITYMERQSFNGLKRDCVIYCNFPKAQGDSFVSNWNQIVGTFFSYDTYYIDTPVTINGCVLKIIDGVGVVIGYTNAFEGIVPEVISFGSNEYPVKVIGSNAFKNCTLTKITLPSGIEKIEESAFSDCINLLSIEINETVTSIESNAFYNCLKLVEIYNLSNLEIVAGNNEYGGIGRYAKVIHTSLDEESYLIEQESFVFIKDREERYYLISYLNDENEVELPDSIENHYYTVSANAFYDKSLEKVILPNKELEVEADSFKNCYSLAEIYFNGSMEDWIQSSYTGKVFSSCKYYFYKNETWERITHIEIPNGVTSISEDKFYGFYGVDSITLPLDCQIDSNAFSSITIKNIYYNSTIESWCNSASYTGDIFFKENYVNHFYISNGSEWEEVIDLVIPDTVSMLREKAFCNFTNLTSVIITDKLEKVEKDVFLNCDKIIKVSSPTIAIPLFKKQNGETLIKEYTITSGEEIVRYTFYRWNVLENVTICEGVKIIREDAFRDCYNLKSLIIPNSVETIEGGAFQVSYSIEEKFDMYNKYSNAYYLGNEENPYLWLIKVKSKQIQSCEIHPDTKYIGTLAFYSCSSLTSITIGQSVIRIDERAFEYCSHLTTVAIASDKLTSIGKYAFQYCWDLTTIRVLPKSLRYIGEGATVNTYRALNKVYFEGTIEDWSLVNVEQKNDPLIKNLFYYSEEEPLIEGNYWHYVKGVPTVWS